MVKDIYFTIKRQFSGISDKSNLFEEFVFNIDFDVGNCDL